MSNAYYEKMKALARQTREQYGLEGPRVMKSDFRRIYKAEGIQLDYRAGLTNLRGAYFFDDLGASVMVSISLPDDPKIFTLAHELKHHLVDREAGGLECSTGNAASVREVGAEVFAAEMLFPEALFSEHMKAMGVESGQCLDQSLVRLKHETKTTLSYMGLTKTAERLGFAKPGSIKQGNWKRLEEQIYGVPLYKTRRLAR